MSRVVKINGYFDPETEKDKAAIKQLKVLLKESEKALAKATKLADKYRLSFDIDGPTYGMGGNYSPVQPNSVPMQPYRRPEEYEQMEKDGVWEHGWLASSMSC